MFEFNLRKGNCSLPVRKSRTLQKSLLTSFSFQNGFKTLIHFKKYSPNIITVVKTLKSKEKDTYQFRSKYKKSETAPKNFRIKPKYRS